VAGSTKSVVITPAVTFSAGGAFTGAGGIILTLTSSVASDGVLKITDGTSDMRFGTTTNNVGFIGTISNAAFQVRANNTVVLTANANGSATFGAAIAATSGLFSSATAGLGYATGAGGTVTQATSKATAFTLSKVTGQITTAADALGAATIVSATWTNTTIAATDVVAVTHVSGGTLGAYTINVAAGAGTATLTLRNNTAGSLSEALVVGFAVYKGVTA
jgi:hypothetical protein